MKKTLYLLRHAEANQTATSDKYRVLTPQGMIAAARMSKVLADKTTTIDWIVSSDAERTRMTAEVFLEQLHLPDEVMNFNEDLYEGHPRHYLEAVNKLPDNKTSVLLVGHNPSISYLAEYLCKHDFGSVPTCGIVALEFESPWAEVSKYTGKLLFYESPDML